MLRSLVFGMILSLVTIGTSYSAVQNSAIGDQVFKGYVEA